MNPHSLAPLLFLFLLPRALHFTLQLHFSLLSPCNLHLQGLKRWQIWARWRIWARWQIFLVSSPARDGTLLLPRRCRQHQPPCLLHRAIPRLSCLHHRGNPDTTAANRATSLQRTGPLHYQHYQRREREEKMLEGCCSGC